MPEPTYKKPKEKIGTDEIFDLVFKAPSVKYGLQEFTNDILNKINAFVVPQVDTRAKRRADITRK
jgi:hypothetical protein